MTTPTASRDRIASAAKSNAQGAFEEALKIDDSWFRSQAMAHVARYATGRLFDQAIDQSLRAAELGAEAYRRSAVLAWAIRACLETGHVERAEKLVEIALQHSQFIEHDGGKAEALILLWQAAFAHQPSNEMILLRLITAGQLKGSWRCTRALVDVVRLLKPKNPKRAIEIANSVADEKLKIKLLKAAEDGKTWQPRPFFW